jgi:hypothetical protein
MSDLPRGQTDTGGLEEPGSVSPPPGSLRGRPWIGIRFDCCGAYARVYRSADGAMYQGRCPRCQRTVRLRVGPDGTDARFFRAE